MHGRLPNIVLSFNQFEGPLPSISSTLLILKLSNNQFSGTISHFLRGNQSEAMGLQTLNLGDYQLSGKIPNCWTRWSYLEVIYLDRNKFTDTIPSSLSSLGFLRILHLRNNRLSGKLPKSFQNLAELTTLDIDVNKFGGHFPSWIGKRLLKLRILVVRSNEIRGRVPDSLCALSSLHILDLACNNLSGTLPKCFNNISTMVAPTSSEYDNRLYYFGEENEYAQLVMKGKMVKYDNILWIVRIIDLSSNFFFGSIPEEITNLSSLVSLNLFNNLLTGVIPANVGNLRSIDSIDFSMNKLSGEIPLTMASLSFLSHLNLSYNNLTGKIPTGTQLQSFDSSSFVGNRLYGPPLTKKCNGDDTRSVNPTVENSGNKHRTEVDGFYVSMALGFVVGFWGVNGSLLFKRSWRFIYFQFLDNIWYKLCDAIGKYHC